MLVSLSMNAVPDALVQQLARRAAGNHRSLQRGFMSELISELMSEKPS